MRAAALCVVGMVAAFSAAAGCSLNDCGPFGDFNERESGGELAVALVADTVTVAFVVGDQGLAGPGSYLDYEVDYETPLAEGFRVAVDLEAGDYGEPGAFVPSGEVRGDTLFVHLDPASDLFRPVCSPAEPYLSIQSVRVRAPVGVYHVRFTKVAGPDLTQRSFASRAVVRPRVVRA